ncbi:ATP-binding cassette domain-containing protein, partial [Burkholderia cenocepacia]
MNSATNETMEATRREARSHRSASPPVLSATGIAKRFDATVALAALDLSIGAGEVVALMGANGAGKSTFVKILSGALQADGGTL